MAKTKTDTKKFPSHNAYVVEGEGDSAFRNWIGNSWQHADGEGLNIALSTFPANGCLVLRTRTEKEGR